MYGTNMKISDNAYEHFDFPTVNRSMYKCRTDINQPLTRKNKKGRGRCVD